MGRGGDTETVAVAGVEPRLRGVYSEAAEPTVISTLPEPEAAPDLAEVIRGLSDRTFTQAVSGDPIYSRADFLRRFGERIVHYHLLAGDVLRKYAFETGLEHCLRQAGFEATRAPAGHRGHDLKIEGEKVSLKTEAAQNIRPGKIRVAKLMECAWSKEFTAPADAAAAMPQVLSHMRDYKRILVLRAFQNQQFPDGADGACRYELVEIPKRVLRAVKDLKAEDFSDLTEAGSTSAWVNYKGKPAFKLIFDGSDNKLTVEHLDMKLCRKHASWWVPRPPEVD